MESKPSSSSSAAAIDEKHGVPNEEVKPPVVVLSDQEKGIIDLQVTAPTLTVGYFSLFRYASRKDVIIMVVATIASIAAGAVMPLMTVRNLSPISCFFFENLRFDMAWSAQPLAKSVMSRHVPWRYFRRLECSWSRTFLPGPLTIS